MSGSVINLRQARKNRVRQAKEKVAEQNRITFGRSKEEKQLTGSINHKSKRDLDKKKLSDQDDN